MTYDAGRREFRVTMNAGGDTPELLGVSLTGARPEQVCGRVLECYVEISNGRIFASVHDAFAGGEVAFDAAADSTGVFGHPWGASASGFWWVTSGIGDSNDRRSASLPPGFGLSDLRVTLGSEVEEATGSLLYQGVLDHLVSCGHESMSRHEIARLMDHVASLRSVADNLERFRLLLPVARCLPIEETSCHGHPQ